MTLKRQGNFITPGEGSKQRIRFSGGVGQDGITRFRETWVCNFSELFNPGVLPAIDSSYPGNPRIRLRNIDFEQGNANIARFNLTYEGFNGTASEAGQQPPVYRLGFVQRQESIASHPNLSQIAAAVGVDNLIYDDDGVFISIGRDSNVAGLVGASEYLDFGLTWQEIKLEASAPSAEDLNTILTQAQLPGGDKKPNGIPANRNWLFSALDYENPGEIFRVTRTFTLSGRNGWQDTLYPSS